MTDATTPVNPTPVPSVVGGVPQTNTISEADFDAELQRRAPVNPTPVPSVVGGVPQTNTISEADFDAELQRRADTRNAEKAKTDAAAKAKAEAAKPDQYHAVITGETCESIAAAYGHKDEGQVLFDFSHPGGPSNGDQIAVHSNLVRGANGTAKDVNGILVPVHDKSHVSITTKLVEGLAFLLPKGWVKTA